MKQKIKNFAQWYKEYLFEGFKTNNTWEVLFNLAGGILISIMTLDALIVIFEAI